MRLVSAGVLPPMLGLLASGALAGDPAGLWLTDDGEAKIRVSRCGANLCGNIAWLKDPNDNKGTPMLDEKNADARKRSRPLIGVPIVLAMKPDGADKWSGKIYNAEDGKTYNASITLAGSTLKVRGCVTVFCQTRTWTRTN